MKIAVVGVGAVGGYFGGRLAEDGHEVTFIARGATLAALAERGLIVESIAGDFRIDPVPVTDDAGSIGTVDAVLFGVKAWQVEEAGRQALPLFGPETVALPLQNGVDAPEILARVVGAERTLGGLCRVFAAVVEPGLIRHAGVEPSVHLGELDDRKSERVERLRAALDGAVGVVAKVPPDIRAALWEKFMMIAATSGVGAVTRAAIGEIRELPETRALLEEAMREIWAVARAQGIAVRDGVVERTMEFVDSFPPEATASMQRDMVAGRPSEFETQCGAVVRHAAAHGVEVPVSRFLYAALLPAELRARARAG